MLSTCFGIPRSDVTKILHRQPAADMPKPVLVLQDTLTGVQVVLEADRLPRATSSCSASTCPACGTGHCTTTCTVGDGAQNSTKAAAPDGR